MTVDQLKTILAASTSKVVEITDTVVVGTLDHLDLDGRELRSTADPMFCVFGNNWSIRNGKIHALDGVTVDIVSTSLGLVSGVWLASERADKPVVQCVGTGQCYDTMFHACELSHPPSMTVPLLYVSVEADTYNSNVWDKIRFQTNGSPAAPCVIVETSSQTSWIYANRFSNINGEIPNAGLFRFGGCYGTILDNITVYDTNLSGNITEDLIWFGLASTPGLRCIHTTVRNYTRLAGVLDTGKFDVNIFQHYTTTILLEQINATGTSLRVQCPPTSTRVGVQDFLQPWRNYYD